VRIADLQEILDAMNTLKQELEALRNQKSHSTGLPVSVRPREIPLFDGLQPTQLPLWLFKIESLMEGESDMAKIRVAVSALEGAALYWLFDQQNKVKASKGTGTCSSQKFQNAFLPLTT
jgi:hypothetical protein